MAKREQSQYQPMGPEVIGVVVMNPAALFAAENRSGPKDAVGFSYAGDSLRWLFLEANSDTGDEETFGVGGGSQQRITIKNLQLANRQTCMKQGIKGNYALVQMTVNNGKGSCGEESFAGTDLKIIDATDEYPLDIDQTVGELKKTYEADLKKRMDKLTGSITDIRKSVAVEVQQKLGPNSERIELQTVNRVHVTWLPDTERLRVEFFSRISEGYAKYAVGIVPKEQQAGNRGIRYGIEYGFELGRIYDVSKKGTIISTVELPPERFVKRTDPALLPGP